MHNKVICSTPTLLRIFFLQINVLYFFFNDVTQWYSNMLLALVFLTRHPHPSPKPIYVSVPLEVSNCQIQHHFGWWYAIGRALRMFPELHVYLIIIRLTVDRMYLVTCYATVSEQRLNGRESKQHRRAICSWIV